ncbi:hypothetical protein D3C80_1778810 [compost metagenome]
MGHLQLEVEAVEELAAAAVTGLYWLPGLGVELLADKATAPASRVTPADAQRGFALAGQADHPVARVRRVGLQVALGQAQAGHRVERVAADFGLCPVADLFLEIRQCAGQENCEKQPAENQPGPGVQPGHRLAETVLHGFFIQ